MSESAASAIEVHGLTKVYRSRRGSVNALSGLDLQVPVGGVHAILGPNGSGKTTLIRVLLGLVRPDEGTVRLLGEPQPEGLERVIDRIGALVEQPRLFGPFTARQTLRLLGEAIGVPTARVDDVLNQVGLLARGDDRVRGFSLGMRQRLAIASTLLKDPTLFIFDEPTNGLDPAGIHDVRATIRRLGDEGRTVLLCSHLLSEVAQVADHVSIISGGRLVAGGPVRELLSAGASGVEIEIDRRDDALATLRESGFDVVAVGSHRLLVTGAEATPRRVNQVLAWADLWPDSLTPHTPDLESVYLNLTDGSTR